MVYLVCKHDFYKIIKNAARCSWCPYCSHLKLCDDINCKLCEENSFVLHHKAIYWSIKNILKPRDIFKYTHNKYLFDCECGHEYLGNIHNITILNRWCHFCCVPCQKLCDDINCIKCYNSSFASIENSKYIIDKNINPRTLIKGSEKFINFNCNKCNNDFPMRINCVGKGMWCPYCILKTEQKVFTELKKYYLIERQFKADWCKNKYKLPFDFVIKNINLIIEVDGIQHFTQVSNRKPPEKTRERDIFKMKCANENGYSIIRILQEDIWYDRYDWLTELREQIEIISNYKIIQNIYMTKNNEYDVYIDDMSK